MAANQRRPTGGTRRADGGAAAPARRAGVKEVAERAGVAPSSVSRVLSGHPDVSTVMRNRVLDAVAALGYEPDLLAQSLRRGATMTAGFVAGDISNPLVSQIALGAEVELRSAGYSILLMNSMNDPALDAAHVRMLRQRRVDGLLLLLADEGNAETLDALRGSDSPYVLVDRDPAPLPDASAVLSDHRRGIADAAEYLISLGHRRIALVNGNPAVRPARERAAALRRACRAHPDVTAVVRSGAFSAEHGEAATEALLSAAEPPSAIIAGGNQILTGVLRALRRANLRIPDQISLITCDDVPLAELSEPPIATISRDPEDIGRQAARLLLDHREGRSARVTTLPAVFRPARSCAAPPPPGDLEET
ncbi:LacI family DNA-binding transcriptional regulator [Actinomadura sp. NBRC 104412]|uniref:LacI family DNA-binding transcriptional regulator n=1 Tax=Actinomadura sp. NBRC 104412 TaxID=3032203 RepID=UPI002552B020|nr:LacI family DNA-binding transcriptional regulator [Actinomadura sp. NBRC 104412]